mmetsp:Transcript_4193/g.5407  ORF Transcript_4193/g.5407 Transcript_4193/m.5407 type:complete len:206 (+) Transcript_4193:646-1263(+)
MRIVSSSLFHFQELFHHISCCGLPGDWYKSFWFLSYELPIINKLLFQSKRHRKLDLRKFRVIFFIFLGIYFGFLFLSRYFRLAFFFFLAFLSHLFPLIFQFVFQFFLHVFCFITIFHQSIFTNPFVPSGIPAHIMNEIHYFFLTWRRNFENLCFIKLVLISGEHHLLFRKLWHFNCTSFFCFLFFFVFIFFFFFCDCVLNESENQ